MKCLPTLLVCLLTAGRVLADAPSVPCPAAPPYHAATPVQKPSMTKAQHLRAAARHLEAAGFTEQAKSLREQVSRDLAPKREELAKKYAELTALQAQINRLQCELRTGPNVVASIKLFECDQAHLPMCKHNEKDSDQFCYDTLSAAEVQELLTMIKKLEKQGLGKFLAEPTLVSAEGIPAHCHVGGEVPVLIPQDEGTVSIDFRRFGTTLELVSMSRDDQKIHTEVRLRQTDVKQIADPESTAPRTFNSTELNTGFEVASGQTIVLCGPGKPLDNSVQQCGCDTEGETSSCKSAAKCGAATSAGCARKGLLVLLRVERDDCEHCAAAVKCDSPARR